MEIFLLIAGAVIVVISFLIPVKKNADMESTRELAGDEIKNLVAMEMNSIKSHVNEVVDESIEYAVEKTERSLERLSNEKIMAVSEYSDTVLQEINRNHEEVMFLYDMLNDKHKKIKETISDVNQKLKEEAQGAAHTTASTVFHPLKPESISEEELISLKEESGISKDALRQSNEVLSADISFIQEAAYKGKNSNERIMDLHKQGKSKIEIAKELGLGVGEVKLVIDLYKG